MHKHKSPCHICIWFSLKKNLHRTIFITSLDENGNICITTNEKTVPCSDEIAPTKNAKY